MERTRVKLTDFGIAKLLDAQGVTSTGQVLGSPAHMAPEQIEGGDVGPRSDVFALGVLLYETMVGRLPFDGKNPAQVLRRVLDGAYPPADREQPRVGGRWASVLAVALGRDAADRYPSIQAFADAIRAELAGVEILEPRREIERFLSDQEHYAEAAEKTMVAALVASGERARTASDFSLASAQFNRALAYRPGDTELVRRVTGLAQRKRVRAIARLAIVSLAVGGVVVPAIRKLTESRSVDLPPPAAGMTKDGARVGAPVIATSPAVVASPRPAAAVPRRRPWLREPPRHKPAPAVTRPVVVDVIGPKGGYLKIDGAREDTWFGVKHDLTVGSHTFEFVPADPECCRPSPPETRAIEEGDTVDTVLLAVAFRDARLHIDHCQPGTLRCRSLFGSDLPVPGELSVSMSRLSAVGLCNMTPDDATQAPSTREVTLTAGQTTEISWP